MFGGGQVGLDPDVVAQVARQIAEVVRGGVQVAVVIGGGNFFRGAQLQQRGMERTRSDYMGMLVTVMNSLALQDFLESTTSSIGARISMPSSAQWNREMPTPTWRSSPADCAPASRIRTSLVRRSASSISTASSTAVRAAD